MCQVDTVRITNRRTGDDRQSPPLWMVLKLLVQALLKKVDQVSFFLFAEIKAQQYIIG